MLSGLAIYEPKTFTSLVEIAARRSKEPDSDWWKLVPEESRNADYDEHCRVNQETLIKRTQNNSIKTELR